MLNRPDLPRNAGLRRQAEQGRSIEKVNQILDAAAALLDELGYVESTRTPGPLIHRANVTKGTFYTYFENPAAVMEHLSLRMLSDACGVAEGLMEEESFETVTDVVDGLIDAYSRFYRRGDVRELWLNLNLTERARAVEPDVNAYVTSCVFRILERVAPSAPGWTPSVQLTAGQLADHLMQFAFHRNPLGDAELLTEAKRATVVYIEDARNRGR
jgi:AcrR family transcriptional regulator